MQCLWRVARFWALLLFVISSSGTVNAAPYAAVVMDARSGKVLHARNADTRLHPASLTKMMTLYVVFDAVRRGEITLDTPIRVSKNAAAEPPSKLYLKSGQTIKLRYLIRASAVKSANDAATAMAEAVSGSEKAFTDRMTRTARALGMSKTTFKNAHGLTQQGHMSTARDMTTLGRALFYHFPEYYNLFSRRTTNAGGTEVRNTNRRLLNAYTGADGIKTGYTRAAGFNLVASAERGKVRIIATMFGGSSGASRNKRVAELLDMGFQRAPRRVATRAPKRPNVRLRAAIAPVANVVVTASLRPVERPQRDGDAVVVTAADTTTLEETTAGATAVAAASTAGLASGSEDSPVTNADGQPAEVILAAAEDGAVEVAIAAATRAATAGTVQFAAVSPQATAVSPPPKPRPAVITYSSRDTPAKSAEEQPEQVLVSRVSASGGRHWGINVGTYNSEYEAQRVLLKTALVEIETLDVALRKVVRKPTGFAANFVGLDERSAAVACQRLSAREQPCVRFGPGT